MPDPDKLKASEIQTAFFLGRLSARRDDASWNKDWKAEVNRSKGQPIGGDVDKAGDCIQEVQRIMAAH